MKILIDTSDIEFFENIKYSFKDSCKISLYKKNLKNISDFEIFILDNLVKANFILSDDDINNKEKLIINISPDLSNNNSVNIKSPFKLADITEKINFFIKYNSKNVIKFDYGLFNFNEKIFKVNEKEIFFTEKEITLIKFIIENKSLTREDLLLNIWGRKDQDNKLIETTIYNIRQKLKNEELEDFFIIKNNNYSIRGSE